MSKKLTPREKGTNPRAKGTNPRAKGTNPRAKENKTGMTDKEKKEFILQNWKVSSGKKISLMLNRYWSEGKKSGEDIVKQAEKIFS